MSSKYTFYAWEKSPETAEEKLVLLKLADMADNNGLVSFTLNEICKECLTSEFKLASTLTSLAGQRLLEKSHVERRGTNEIHHFRLLLSDTMDLQVVTAAEIVSQPQPTITTMEQSSAPSWTYRSFGLYNIPVSVRDAIWQKFARENNTNTTNLYRLESQFDAWLDGSKKSGALSEFLGEEKKAPKKAPARSAQSKNNQYVSTHDLDEHSMPDWAQQTVLHAGLEVDPHLFWERFVVYYKSRANEYLSVTQLLNKLRYWIVNEKQSVENRKQAEERRKVSYQQGNSPQKKLSPSEEFREYLRAQGKKPNF